MARKNDIYEIKIIHGNGGPTGDRQVKKLLREGWEQIEDKGGFLMTGRTRTFRRPNPKYAGNSHQIVATTPEPVVPVETGAAARQVAAQADLNEAQRELAEARAEFYRIRAEKAERREAKRVDKAAKKSAKLAAKVGRNQAN